MLAALPRISVDMSVWLFDQIVSGHITDEESAAVILKGKKIVGASLTPLFLKINSCLQNCRIPTQAIAALILQSKAGELKPDDLKAALSALQKSLISKKMFLETISSLFHDAAALDTYKHIDSAFVSRLAAMDTHAIDECSVQLSLANRNPLFGKEFLQRHNPHLSKTHADALAMLAPTPAATANSTSNDENSRSGSSVRLGTIKSLECVNLRAGPSIYSKSYGCFPPGTNLVIVEMSNIEETHHGETAYWAKVKIGNRVGWMFGAFVKEN
jgi:hypothetical protein